MHRPHPHGARPAARKGEAVRRAFWGMHETAAGRAILDRGLIAKMARVEDSDYDPIREMARLADRVSW